tara:strand:- start:448 stop:663 length:216 start_codon:yes stop_codon:yes gene_type:complete
MTKQNILIVGFVIVFLMIGLYFTTRNYEFLYHTNNISASPVNYPKDKCLASGGKYITGWIGGYYSVVCIPG